jgi:predicted DNA-binding antitoxin AbrB/MazE fold protein
MMTVGAVYKDGVLRPAEPLPVPDGSRVELVIRSLAENGQPSPDPRSAAATLREIAAMPMEESEEECSGRDHDPILYSALR